MRMELVQAHDAAQRPCLKLLIEKADRGDPGCDDSQEGGGNDGHAALNGAQAQQQRLGDPAGTCATTQQPVNTRRPSTAETSNGRLSRVLQPGCFMWFSGCFVLPMCSATHPCIADGQSHSRLPSWRGVQLALHSCSSHKRGAFQHMQDNAAQSRLE